MSSSLSAKVCVLGLGHVGLPTAIYCAGKGLEVWGYDITPAAIRKAKENGISRALGEWHEIPPVDFYIICVSTTLKNGVPDISSVFDVCKKISEKARSCLVSIESTVVPGTCRRIREEILKENISLVHVPHRFWAEDQGRHGVKQLRVIGALDENSLNLGSKSYVDMLDIPLHSVSSIEIAEMSKIAENAFRYITIAFAEELKLICENVGLDFSQVRDACNTKWNIEVPEARNGIGGHCLPKDTRYLALLSRRNILLKSALLVDTQYRKWVSRQSTQPYHKGRA
jgi:nucleotide sugar dehydrogenase